MWEPSQATLDIGICVHCGGKGTAPGCAHAVGAQRYQAANSMSIGSTLAQIFLGFRLEQLGSRRPLIRAVGLSSLAFSN